MEVGSCEPLNRCCHAAAAAAVACRLQPAAARKQHMGVQALGSPLQNPGSCLMS